MNVTLKSSKRSATVEPAQFITVADWAARMKVSKRQIFRWMHERIIPPYDFAVGKTRRWHISTYETWLEQHTEGN